MNNHNRNFFMNGNGFNGPNRPNRPNGLDARPFKDPNTSSNNCHHRLEPQLLNENKHALSNP